MRRREQFEREEGWHPASPEDRQDPRYTTDYIEWLERRLAEGHDKELFMAQVEDPSGNEWFNLVRAVDEDAAHYVVLKHHREKYDFECKVFITEVIE